ncbi:cupin domain-containing protein [Dyella sp. C11]|uniref:cupin domain-containing protein n=1 Tax=Dyella sp. C11 TaxID=2126991 RepID=UPI000D656967|nr:cupin domain-containing protein [Dyella sp. C11]
MKKQLCLLAALFAISLACLADTVPATTGHASQETVQPAFAHALPNAPGKKLVGVLVTYTPGGTSKPHRHGDAFVVGYVLSGEIRSQLADGSSRVYHAGESWSESPGAHHVVSENASKTEPASLLAIFVVDANQKDLVTYDTP